MSKVATTVTLDEKEIRDAVMEKAREYAKILADDKTVGSAHVEFTYPEPDDDKEGIVEASAEVDEQPNGAVVTFFRGKT